MTPSKPRRPGTRSRGLPPQRSSPEVETAETTPTASGPATAAPRVVDLTGAGSVALVGRNVVVVGIGHELEDDGTAARGLGIAAHLARTAENVTVMVGVAHRPSWRRIARRARVLRPRPPKAAAGRPDVRRVDYTLGPDQTVVTRAVYEATHLARAALAEMPGPPDLVVATTPGLGGVVAAARVARRFGAPLVVVVHDLLATAPGAAPGLEATGALAALERHALATADQVVITNESFRDGVLGYGINPSRVHLMPIWTDLEPSPLTRRQAREQLGWPTRGPMVVLPGPRGARADVATALEAVRQLHRRDVRFVLLSDASLDGGTRRLLLEQAAELPGVRLGEPAGAERLPLVLAAADLVLVCERRDAAETALTAAVAGAFAAGRPVVAAARPGGATAVEVERSGGAGLCVAAGSATALAQALAAVLDNPDRRLAMADQATAHARQALAHRAAMKVMDSVVEAAIWPWMRHI